MTEFAVGDRVFGLGYRFGAHAEYVCVRESGRSRTCRPAMTFEEAAAICDGACQALAASGVVQPPGSKAPRVRRVGLVRDGGGAARQHLGAHVTAVCNTKNVELVRSLGADEVIDYLREDFTKNGQTYDVVLDAVGKHSFCPLARLAEARAASTSRPTGSTTSSLAPVPGGSARRRSCSTSRGPRRTICSS